MFKNIVIIAFLVPCLILKTFGQAENFPGHALYYTATNQYVYGSGINTALSAITMELWIYHHTISNDVERYITIGGEVAVLRHDGTEYGGPNELHFYIKDSNGDLKHIRVDNALVTGEWMHIAGTYNGSDMILYLNGELIGSASPGTGLYAPDGNFEFSKSNEMTDIKMDEVRVWNDVRTEQEIREHMYLTLSGSETGLLNYWQFNEGSGTTVEDVVGSSDGTIYNIDNSNWLGSTIPCGGGYSLTEDPTYPAGYTFPDLNLEISSLSGNLDITGTRIERAPNVYPADVGMLFDTPQRYWVVKNFSGETFNANWTFSMPEELSDYYGDFTGSVRLFHRTANSDGAWAFLKLAHQITHQEYGNEATVEFSSISTTGQFLILLLLPDTTSGNALSFDGQNEYVQVENVTEFAYYANDFTVEAWVKPETMTAGHHNIISKGTEWTLDLYDQGDGLTLFELSVNDDQSFSAYPMITAEITGKWIHVAGVRNTTSGTIVIYVNGAAGTPTEHDPITQTSAALKIGEDFKGEIDEARIWWEARTESQIREKMFITTRGDDLHLLSFYQFNEPSGTRLKDLGWGNDGTLVNMEAEDWTVSTAPVPFQSIASSNWGESSTWQSGQGVPVLSWSRVYINNDVVLNQDQTLIDLTIDNTASLDVSSTKDITVTGKLIIHNEDYGIVLKSDASGSASLIIEGSQSGAVTVERYLTADKWHYISGQTNIPGTFNTLNMGLTGDVGNDQFYRWEEDYEYGGYIGNWVDILNGEDGTGINSLMDDEGFVSCKGYAITCETDPKTFSFSGEPYLTSQSILLKHTATSTFQGSNLVGNPFCSTIALNSNADGDQNFLDQNATALDDAYEAVYIWNEEASWNGTTNADYDTYNNSSSAFFAQPGQAFMVQAASNDANLNFNANIRKHGAAAFYKCTTDTDEARFCLFVTSPDNQGNKTELYFHEGMSKGLDPSFDAAKLKGNPDLALYTRFLFDDGNDFAIQSLPFFKEDYAVPVGLDINQPGDYTFGMVHLENIPEDVHIYFEDFVAGQIIDLKKDSTYNCNISSSGSITDRFKLHFTRESLRIIENNITNHSIRIFTNDKNITVQNPETKTGTIMILNMMGQQIQKANLKSASSQRIRFLAPTGYYLVKIDLGNDLITKKVFVR